MKVFNGFRNMLPGLAGLVALGLTASSWGAGCIQDSSSGTAGPILFAKGTQSCATISGYSGCSISKGKGSCDIKDSNGHVVATVTSSVGLNGSITWTKTGSANIFAAGLNGAQSGNACVYFYPQGEAGPQSGIGYNSSASDSSPTFTNIQEAFYCTDLNAPVVPPTESEIKPCQSTNEGGLIEGVNCGLLADGTVVSIWTPTYDDDESGNVTGSSLEQCYCNDNSGVQGSYPCNISGEDDGDPNTLEDCFSSKPLGQPTLIQLFPDATSCSSPTGTTTCTCIDNPFTPNCNECTHKTPSGGKC